MKKFPIKFGKLALSSFLALIPLNQTTLFASELLLANNNDEEIEEVKLRKVNKKGKLVVKFCSKLKDYKGYVEVKNQIFNVQDADIREPRRIVWKNTDLPRLRGDAISIDNLSARYYDEERTEPLRVVDEGSCPVGILPIILIGAGIAVGVGGSDSGSSSSN